MPRAHYEAPFHIVAEVSAKREITRWHYRSQLEQALKHGRSLAEELDTTQPVYGLVINGGRIDGDTRLQEVYREFVEENELGDDSQVRVIPMCTEHLSISLHEIHESLKPQQARFSSEMFGELLETFYTGLLDFEKSRKGEWMLQTWREQVIERARSKSQGALNLACKLSDFGLRTHPSSWTVWIVRSRIEGLSRREKRTRHAGRAKFVWGTDTL